jgi:hypothetical protein
MLSAILILSIALEDREMCRSAFSFLLVIAVSVVAIADEPVAKKPNWTAPSLAPASVTKLVYG